MTTPILPNWEKPCLAINDNTIYFIGLYKSPNGNTIDTIGFRAYSRSNLQLTQNDTLPFKSNGTDYTNCAADINNSQFYFVVNGMLRSYINNNFRTSNEEALTGESNPLRYFDSTHWTVLMNGTFTINAINTKDLSYTTNNVISTLDVENAKIFSICLTNNSLLVLHGDNSGFQVSGIDSRDNYKTLNQPVAGRNNSDIISNLLFTTTSADKTKAYFFVKNSDNTVYVIIASRNGDVSVKTAVIQDLKITNFSAVAVYNDTSAVFYGQLNGEYTLATGLISDSNIPTTTTTATTPGIVPTGSNIPSPIHPKPFPVVAIIGIVIGAFVCIALVTAILLKRNKRIKSRTPSHVPQIPLVQNPPSRPIDRSVMKPTLPPTPRLQAPFTKYNGTDSSQSTPYAPIGNIVLSQYQVRGTSINSEAAIIQLCRNIDTEENIVLKWIRDEITWQREAVALNQLKNSTLINPIQNSITIPSAKEWKYILVLEPYSVTLDYRLSQDHVLKRAGQIVVVKALLAGLAWCHSKKIIHLSICTESLVQDESGSWVLWSFDGSRFEDEVMGQRQGLLIGHGKVMAERNQAPELLISRRNNQLGETRATEAMDAWAAGCVIFEIFTGRALFGNENTTEMALAGQHSIWKNSLEEIEDDNAKLVAKKLLVPNPEGRISLSEAETLFARGR